LSKIRADFAEKIDNLDLLIEEYMIFNGKWKDIGIPPGSYVSHRAAEC